MSQPHAELNKIMGEVSQLVESEQLTTAALLKVISDVYKAGVSEGIRQCELVVRDELTKRGY